MKHLLTLLITVVAFTTTYAQSRKIDEAKRVINGESREERRVNGESGSRSSETSTSREAEIDRINREYDRKINSVRRNPILSADQKNRRVR
ncbi:MAG TPA: hypothetical protein VEZ55_07270, partial [Chitinophagaceae bacterium]|nr:hypothetical protein [Chitinophagaceae bacterium]